MIALRITQGNICLGVFRDPRGDAQLGHGFLTLLAPLCYRG